MYEERKNVFQFWAVNGVEIGGYYSMSGKMPKVESIPKYSGYANVSTLPVITVEWHIITNCIDKIRFASVLISINLNGKCAIRTC